MDVEPYQVLLERITRIPNLNSGSNRTCTLCNSNVTLKLPHNREQTSAARHSAATDSCTTQNISATKPGHQLSSTRQNGQTKNS